MPPNASWAKPGTLSMQATHSRYLKGGLSWALVAAFMLLGGCGTPGVLLSAAGLATDTSITWEVVKHLHAKATEGDDTPCNRLDSVQRMLNPRCGAFVVGSLRIEDIRRAPQQGCLLGAVVRDARLWPAMSELIDKGAQPERCTNSPLVELAQLPGCPDFSTASPATLTSMRWLAEVDARSVHHDVMRMLSCPGAVAAGLGLALDTWLAQGVLDTDKLAFGPFGALDPGYLESPFARALEARGHTARKGLGGYDGVQPRGFELALRGSHWAALDWWLARVPELANRVPPVDGRQLPWLPLARVLSPGFLTHPASQTEMVEFLLARGANPRQKLPFDANTSVVQYARILKSPQIVLLDPPVLPAVVAATAGRAEQ